MARELDAEFPGNGVVVTELVSDDGQHSDGTDCQRVGLSPVGQRRFNFGSRFNSSVRNVRLFFRHRQRFLSHQRNGHLPVFDGNTFSDRHRAINKPDSACCRCPFEGTATARSGSTRDPAESHPTGEHDAVFHRQARRLCLPCPAFITNHNRLPTWSILLVQGSLTICMSNIL